jgi:hypothetical protein
MEDERVVLISTLRNLSLTEHREVVTTIKSMILRYISTQIPGCTTVLHNSSPSAIRSNAKSQDRVDKQCPFCAKTLFQGVSHCSENSPVPLSW